MHTEFSSGIFSCLLIAILFSNACISSFKYILCIVFILIIGTIGSIGAYISDTPTGIFSIATLTLFILIWLIGSGLDNTKSILITPETAFLGVIISASFLLFSTLGFDVISLMQGVETNRPSGLYFEPSHYALYVMPLWLIAFEKKKNHLFLYLIMIYSLIFCFSATLLLFILISAVLWLFISRKNFKISINSLSKNFIVIFVIVSIAFSVSNSVQINGQYIDDYISSRLNGLMNPASERNLSSLVILQGLEISKLSFQDSMGLGVGMGNFGTSEKILSQSAYRDEIMNMRDGLDLSIRDGAILINKWLGELGVLGLILLVILVLNFRTMKSNFLSDRRYYHFSLFATILCLFFVRALPYFAAPTCLAFLSLFSSMYSTKNQKQNNNG
ncbi:hypothetical protein G6705_03000 [Polynucleobacter paneuropaeus]|nr:hypothetical protein [Polynucleobacter paneuropaeus]